MKVIFVDNGYSRDNLFILENGAYYDNEEMLEFACAPHVEKYTVRHVDESRLGSMGMALAQDNIDDPDEWLKTFEMVYNDEEVKF